MVVYISPSPATRTIQPRPGILSITPYVGGKAKSAAGDRTLKLSANESALGPSSAAIAAYSDLAGTLHRYPDGDSIELTLALGRRFNIDPKRVVCGAGSDELIALLVRAYAGPGDEVLVSAHGFLMYRLAAMAAGAQPVSAPERNLKTDVDAMLAAVTGRTKLVFVANPNNPTGSYLDEGELVRLHAGLPTDVLLVVDAAYAEFVDATDYASGLQLAKDRPNVVTTRTFSKLFGLAALRIGWLFGSPEVVDVIHRIRGPFNVGTPAQAAAVAALADLDHQAAARAHNDRWLPFVSRAVEALGLKVWPSVGNFVLIEFPTGDGQNADAAAAHLEAEGIIPRQMHAYGLGHCLRITIGTAAENERLLAALGRFAQRQAA